MTTNQTIDGVPRVLVEWMANSGELLELLGLCSGELRALLDAPAEPKPTGLSQGWNLTRKHDGFVVGHQSVAYPPDEKAIERAERDGYVWVPFLVPAAQPQGEPVALLSKGFTTLETSDGKYRIITQYKNRDDAWSDYTALCKAEQPAPVAVPRLEMAHVVRAHMEIPGCPVLTSNQCHALAMKLNESLNPSL
ncbi:hypothetical protein [Pseudomonas veronii]